MSIATEITRLQNAKDAIKTSIIAKGVEVSSDTTLDGYSTLIDAISTGSGSIPANLSEWAYDANGIVTSITFTASTVPASAYTYSALETAVLSSNVTSIGNYSFFNCRELTNITIPSSVESIGTSAFAGCHVLSSVTIPSSVTSIGYNAFQFCSGLTSVSIGSGITKISNSSFSYCTSLTSITIPENINRIDNCAFQGCSGLTSITIPSGVTAINLYAFDSCSGLTSITCEATTPPTLGNYAFDNTNNCPIYVPSASVDAYKSSWSAYESRIVGMQAPCYTVTDDIASYTDTEWTDVYDKATSKWYKLNNNDVYEQYGVFETGTSLNDFTTYTGKLAGVDGVEYQWDGTQWNNVGTYAAGSGTSYELSQDTVSEYVGQTWPTSFRLIKSELEQLGSLDLNIITDDSEQISITYYGSDVEYDYRGRDSENGTATDDGTYYSFSLSQISEITISYIDYSASLPIHIIVDDKSVVPTVVPTVGYPEKAKPSFAFTASTTADLVAFECPFVGQYGIVGTDVYIFDSNYKWIPTEYNLIAYYNDGNINVVPTVSTTLTEAEAKPSYLTTSAMTDAIINSGVTTIDGNAFYECTSLSSVTIADTVATIGGGAFRECSALTSITCYATTAPSISNDTFYGIKTGGTLYYPSGSNYSSWLSSSNYYLGKYGWTSQTIS